MFILVPGIIVPLVLVLLLAVVCLIQRHRRAKSGNGKSNNASSRSNPTNTETLPLNKSGTNIKDFPISHVRFLQELGEGAFGKVFKGEVLGLYGDSTLSKVAIKTLKENAQPKMKNDFRREVDLMSDMRHPNIVCLLGVSMKQEPMCMLFEFMPLGDLHEYLVTHSPTTDLSPMEEEGRAVLDFGDMLHIVTQIASGMEYLSGRHFVHRDLAARNILVGEHLNVKISDFGLSRDIYSSDYYRVQSKSLLPVRWMPPESIMYGKFTIESDIWSFGVVVWEIFSYGLQPYYGYSNQEVIEVVRSRQILPSPEECPSRMYSLMVECWHEVPNRRPLFREIHSRMRAWRTEMMMQNPHWSSLSQSHSAHSGSTHQSSHSGPSHQGSTGPSNTTAMTGLTTGSSGGSESHGISPAPPMMPPSYHALPPHYLANQIQMQPGHVMMPPPAMHQPTAPHLMANQMAVQKSFQQHQQQQQAIQQQQALLKHQEALQQQRATDIGHQQHNQNLIPQNAPTKISPAGSVTSSHKSSNSSGSQISSSTAPSSYKAGPALINHTQSNGPSNVSDCNRFNSTQNSYIPDPRPADQLEDQ